MFVRSAALFTLSFLAAARTLLFAAPDNVAFGIGGRVYVTDNDGSTMRIVILDRSGDYVEAWSPFVRAPGRQSGPEGIAVDSSGNIFVTDAGACRVLKLSPQGRLLRIFGRGCGMRPGQFEDPGHVAVAANGDVYVSDAKRNAVTVFSKDGIMTADWQRPKGAGANDFDLPEGLALNASGQAYVEDWRNHRIVALDRRGRTRALFEIARAPAGVSNSAGITWAAGRIYVADWRSHRIVILGENGHLLSAIANAPGKPARFKKGPTSIAVDPRGFIYFADGDSIRVLNASLDLVAVYH